MATPKVDTLVRFTRSLNFGPVLVIEGDTGRVIAHPDNNSIKVAVRVQSGVGPVAVAAPVADITWTRPRTGVGEIVSHRVARSTGATITVERTGEGSWIECEPGWMTSCLNHGTNMQHDSRKLATAFASTPEDWCEFCFAITEGRADRITVGLVR